jgi:hypothetical protein
VSIAGSLEPVAFACDILNSFTALGTPIREVAAQVRPGKGKAGQQPVCATEPGPVAPGSPASAAVPAVAPPHGYLDNEDVEAA